MKKSIYLILSALLITISAHAQETVKDPQGAGVVAPGFDCDVCNAHATSAPLQANNKKSHCELLPDGCTGDAATETNDASSASGSK